MLLWSESQRMPNALVVDVGVWEYVSILAF